MNAFSFFSYVKQTIIYLFPKVGEILHMAKKPHVYSLTLVWCISRNVATYTRQSLYLWEIKRLLPISTGRTNTWDNETPEKTTTTWLLPRTLYALVLAPHKTALLSVRSIWLHISFLSYKWYTATFMGILSMCTSSYIRNTLRQEYLWKGSLPFNQIMNIEYSYHDIWLSYGILMILA